MRIAQQVNIDRPSNN